MSTLTTLTLTQAYQALKRREITSRELTQACLDEIAKKDGEIHAFLEVFADALEQADEADRRINLGEDQPLLGVPVAIKDNILFADHKVSAASKILEGYTATYDATVVKKLKAAGAVIIGRTNMDEFAMGSSTENSAYGVTKNPHDPTRVAGGSSGGSAAAVAAQFVPASLGSDTGGSIRQPAAFCGVVGLKTTYGRVSRSGLIALASSLDQIGPFAKTVSDAEVIYKVIAGPDALDSTSITEKTYPAVKSFSKKIGVPRTFVESEGVDVSVKENFAEALKQFESLGYEIVDIELPHIAMSLPVYYIVMPAEASSNLARFDGVKYGLHKEGKTGIEDYFETRGEGFGRETRRRIVLGTYVLSSGYYDEYYGSALAMRDVITRELREAFTKVDLILTPTTPTPAFKIGEKTTDPLAMYLADIFTVSANIAGVPSISLPSGFADNLPLGIELTADLGREDNLFTAGKEFMRE